MHQPALAFGRPHEIVRQGERVAVLFRREDHAHALAGRRERVGQCRLQKHAQVVAHVADALDLHRAQPSVYGRKKGVEELEPRAAANSDGRWRLGWVRGDRSG